MNYQQVFQRFCELSRLSEKEGQQYRWLCNNAADELSEMLVSNIDKTKYSGRLSAAAAAMAYYRYIIIAKNGGVTGEEKIAKTIEYYKREKEIAKYCSFTLFSTIELKNTGGQTETEVCLRGSRYTNYYASVDMLRYALKEAVIEAQQESEHFNNWFTVRVWIKTYLGDKLIDEEALNDYEITFRRGVEI